MSTRETTPETTLTTQKIAGFTVRCYVPEADNPEDRDVRIVEATGPTCELLRSSADDDEWVLTVAGENILITSSQIAELRRLLRPRFVTTVDQLSRAA